MSATVAFDMAQVGAATTSRLMTALVVPRPIAWIVSCDQDGVVNAAPFSFFNLVCAVPPILAIGVQPRPSGGLKDTRANIAAHSEFVVHLVGYDVAQAMNETSAEHPPHVDELATHGIATVPSTIVRPPRIAASPVSFECRLRQQVDFGDDRGLILADVLMTHVAQDAVLDAATGRIDSTRLDLVARMHGAGWYLRSTDLFEMRRPARVTPGPAA